MGKPKIILICKGGIIQDVISNQPIDLVNLDYDIFEDGPPDSDETYENRHYGDNVTVLSKRKFAKKEAELAKEWDELYEKSIQ